MLKSNDQETSKVVPFEKGSEKDSNSVSATNERESLYSKSQFAIGFFFLFFGVFILASQVKAHEDPIKSCKFGSLLLLGSTSISGTTLNYMHQRFDGHTAVDGVAKTSCGQFEEYSAAFNLGQLQCEALAQSMAGSVKGVTVSGRIFAKFTGPKEFLMSSHHEDYDGDFGVTFECYLCTDPEVAPYEVTEPQIAQ